MPQYSLTGERRLRNVMRCEQCDVRPYKQLGDVEQSRIGNEAHPERIVRHEVVVQLLGPQPGIPFQKPIDVSTRLCDQSRIENVPEQRIALALVLLSDRSVVVVAHAATQKNPAFLALLGGA